MWQQPGGHALLQPERDARGDHHIRHFQGRGPAGQTHRGNHGGGRGQAWAGGV